MSHWDESYCCLWSFLGLLGCLFLCQCSCLHMEGKWLSSQLQIFFRPIGYVSLIWGDTMWSFVEHWAFEKANAFPWSLGSGSVWGDSHWAPEGWMLEKSALLFLGMLIPRHVHTFKKNLSYTWVLLHVLILHESLHVLILHDSLTLLFSRGWILCLPSLTLQHLWP